MKSLIFVILTLFAFASMAQVSYWPPLGLLVPNGTAGAIPYYISATEIGVTPAGTVGQCLLSGGTGTPTWGNCALAGSGITSLNSQTGATQVFANDTNVIVTSSNNTHSLGWASTLSLARGGTAASLTAANGGIVYSDATKLQILTAGTAGQFLSSNGADAPFWDTPAGGANQQLSNLLGPTSLNADLIFASTAIVQTVSKSDGTNTAVITFTSGSESTGSGASGQTNLKTGTSAGGSTGAILVQSGAASTSSGGITLQSGTGASSGIINLISGTAATGNSGAATLRSGNATVGNSGDVTLQSGTAGGTRGFIRFKDGSEGTSGQVWTSQDTTGGGHWAAAGASLSSLNAQTGATQVFANDTNNIITSSNNTHTLGWASTLAIARGGTGGTAAAVVGGMVYTTASAYAVLAAGTSGQVLTSQGGAAPQWAAASTGITSLAAQTGATQIFANDTNVVMTSSNNTHTLGWASTLSLARGGTQAALTAANGGLAYSTASTLALTAAGTSGQVVLSGGAGAPTFEGPLALNHGGSNASLTAANGGIVWSDAAKMQILIAGTSGQTLKSGGAGTPTWGADATGITSLGAQTGATQVFANDTNVLITSSNNTHSLSWGSTLSLARGGTQAALSAVNGGIVYSNATTLAVLAIGTTSNVLSSNGGAAPSWVASSSVGNPTGWTCTVRSQATNALTATVSCTGNEKVISAGCSLDQSGTAPLGPGLPTNQGWTCFWVSAAATNTTYANCCL